MIGWVAIVLSQRLVPDAIDDVLTVLAFFFTFGISALTGALASAEERQLGTLEWQVALPVATSTQWTIKVAVALGLTIALILGLTTLLTSVSPGLPIGAGLHFIRLPVVCLMVAITTGSLYVSSLCGSGVQALVIATATMPGVALAIQTVLIPLGAAVFQWSSRLAGKPPGPFELWDLRLPTVPALLLLGGFVAVVLRFARANHRSAERGAMRVWMQVVWMAVAAVIGVAVWGGLAGAIR